MGYIDAVTDWWADGLAEIKSDPDWTRWLGMQPATAIYDLARQEIDAAERDRGLPPGMARDWRASVDTAEKGQDHDTAKAIAVTARAYDETAGGSFERKEHNVTVLDPETDLKNVVAGAVGLYVVGGLVLLVLMMRR